jgi:hypothetical protein
MNKLILTAAAIVLAVLTINVAGAEPESGYTIYETCHHYIAIKHASGECLKIRKVSMHDELNRQLPYTTCVEEVVFTGPPTKKFVQRNAETEVEPGCEPAGTYRTERPVVMRLGGAVDREISGIMVHLESEGIQDVRRPAPTGPRH